MCFSAAWLENLLVFIVIVCAVIALIMLLIRFVVPKLGIGGEILAFVVAALRIILWAFVCICAIYFIFALISCVSGNGMGLGFLRIH
jgi:hypothetical protein